MIKQDKQKWYIVQVIPNHEQKVKESLENRDFSEPDSGIKEVLLPMTYHTTKLLNVRRKPMFPGYLYVKVYMTDESWYVIRNTQYVTGIVGSSGQRTKPTPVPEAQINKIISAIQEEEMQRENITVKVKGKFLQHVDYEIGDIVTVKSGDFANKDGKVGEINFIKQLVTIELEFFGRIIQVKIDLTNVVKK
ncbi:MAG: hypothetical protein GQ557_01935 [Mycoplasmataceae bacterium]|nr:hypothetical protein [Mycoplasmataceae bacterium]